ncbi:GNAT family N-acetyltransferase [soil metagenome]
MKIRSAAINDIEALTNLFDAYRVFYNKPSDLKTARAFLTDRIYNKDSTILIVENSEGVLTGFVQMYPLFSSTRMKPLWLLNDLFVFAEFRGLGYSIALIDACKDLCRKTGACGLMLETAKDNIIGNTLYKKTGFTLDNDHNYYEWETI